MNQKVHTTKILLTNPDRILKGCLKSVIHSWDVTPAFHYHLGSPTMNLQIASTPYFMSKISNIRLELEDVRTGPPNKFYVNDQIPYFLDHFEPLSQENGGKHHQHFTK